MKKQNKKEKLAEMKKLSAIEKQVETHTQHTTTHNCLCVLVSMLCKSRRSSAILLAVKDRG